MPGQRPAVLPVPPRHLLDGRLCLQLLPRSAYSGRDPVQWQTLGIALEHQQGVHAIDSDRRMDFDTWPGTLALTPPGVEVFSESARGGEYLLARWRLEDEQAPTQRRLEIPGHARGLSCGRQLRRLLLDPHTDPLALEAAALDFVGLCDTAPVSVRRSGDFGPILQRFAEAFAQPLSLTRLAAEQGQSELRFLRDFTRAIGMTPHAYLLEVRVQAARRLIENSDLALAEIALDCGFAHQSHLGSAFRKVLGVTPGEYRRRLSCKSSP
ncbi:AraC family transcriptional regulator [Pseudomonas gingeri NCPPB 3146 = LMG 5327]|uniref:Helix-turn-helix transcriptional regulator n=2 Tax=Pseudomonas gingeri TaxID=117681 RepID=A0A7Y7XYM0_9PSED|nr:AraC family transcriptional regulator [Pseudomonas gingeri]NVZ62386.1 helix-turn-helix transcriptional regulator [Pseudomonas gingeri]NVZ76913.1 helix-turn-helix transcriptional regulator [Pseudomonas gingeri]NWC13793.1 helix-turn-helix transcriptional regulator [Pseudomonas gingeri]PNQ94032.1 AraC family transcriptional regulator [Pseudomonas gingeri NCPPB 3146 = LMG 5327]